MKLPAAFLRYRAEIDAELRSILDEFQSPLYDMLRYHLGWLDEQGNVQSGYAGKALRPTLCLLASEATGGVYQQALPAAAALEFVHNFSLIHDDVQDNDRERRHRPTLWMIWGKPQAINAGTAMRILANLAITHLAQHGVPIEKQLRAQRLLDETSLSLIEGQYLDISFESRLDVGVADYMGMIEKKTAALIACSLELGALLGTNDERVVRAFRNFGRNLGIAFQIRDDVLGIWGDSEKTGKPVGSDIRRRKKSLPILYAWEKAGEQARDELMEIYSKAVIDDAQLERVLDILEHVQAHIKAQRMAEEYCERALAEIQELPLPVWARDDLEEIASFLTQREL